MSNPRVQPSMSGLTRMVASLLILATIALSPNVGAQATIALDPHSSPTIATCDVLADASEIPNPVLVDFDDLPAGVAIAGHYQTTHGVTFEDNRNTSVMTYDHPAPSSPPVVAMSQTTLDPGEVPLRFTFDAPQTHIGMMVGNGNGDGNQAILRAFDADGDLLCEVAAQVFEEHTTFLGLRDAASSITSVSLDYPGMANAESIDDLHFSAAPVSSLPVTLFVFPNAAAPEAQLRVRGYGYPPLTDLSLILSCPDAGLETELRTVLTDIAGRLQAEFALPAYPPNPCLVVARYVDGDLAEAPLTLLPAIEIDFSPQTGPPGTIVNFSVSNLVAGELRLDYAGRVVVGPLPTSGGSFTGAFVIPSDRPEPLGSAVEIRATNLILGCPAGAISGQFLSQAELPNPSYQIVDLELPGADYQPGSEFILSGRISPAPQAPLDRFQVLPLWQKADGRTLPIGREPVHIGSDGAFTVRVRVPSLLTGDPTWPEDGDLVGVMLLAPSNEPQPFLEPAAGPPVFPSFSVKVVDSQTQQLIDAAKVSLQVWDTMVDAGSLGQLANTAATGIPNQVGQVLGTTELTDDEKAIIALTKAMCIPIGIPVNQNKWELINPTLDQTLSEPSVLGLLQQNSIIVENTGVQTERSEPGSTGANAGNIIPYLLTVDALDAGYGLKDADGSVKHFSQLVNFHLSDLTYRDLQGNLLPNPYVVALSQLSSGDQSALGPIGVFVAGIGAPEMPAAAQLPRFSRYYSAKTVPAGVQIQKLAEGSILVSLSLDQVNTKLGSTILKLDVDNVWAADIPLQFDPGLSCAKFKGTQQTSAPLYKGKAVIPNAHLLSPGLHTLTVKAQLADGNWVSYNYQLQLDPVPASWFSVSAAGSRILTWTPGEVKLFTPWLTQGTDFEILTSGAKTPETGPLDNRTLPNANFYPRAEANGHKGAQTSGFVSGQALNKSGTGCALDNCPPNPGAAQVATVISTSFGPRRDTLVPQVTFDVPAFYAGVPFVAEVLAGGSYGYAAYVTYYGTVSVADDASVSSALTIRPEANFNAGMWVKGYLLGGIIAQGKVSLDFYSSLWMPITYHTDSGPDTGDACFQYRSGLRFIRRYGCIPYTDICLKTKESYEPLFNDADPEGCGATVEQIGAAQEPSVSYINLASNGHGGIMAVWQNTRTSLATSLFNGVTWSATQSIPTGLGSTQPQVAFLTPTRALAVWTEMTMSEAQVPGLTEEALIRSQRIAYAIWDGTSWSPPQPLTQPLLGEGGPVLVACPEWQTGCPAGGAVTAMWERNLSTDLSARNIRLYMASFQNLAWSAVQPVDSAGTFTDILPQIAYANGRPLAAWVRDSDTDLTDSNSRRIALRFLDTGPTFTPAELPSAIAEVTLAVDATGAPLLAFTQLEIPTQLLSNQRPLWVAQGFCTGSSCSWQPHLVTDTAGRNLYAERPLLTHDAMGQPQVTFRGLGFGGNVPGQASDPPGMTYNAGELVQAGVNPVNGLATPVYLTQDGAVNWMPAVAYDPLLDVTLAMAVKDQLPVNLNAATATMQLPPAPDLPIVVAPVVASPDFALVEAALTGGPATGTPLQLTARIANAGAMWSGSVEQPLEIAANWDGDPGIGVPAGQLGVTEMDAGPVITVTLDLALPPQGLDAPHVLHVVVNPGLTIAESSVTNNSETLDVGGIDAPVSLWAQVETGSATVFLSWEAATDRRVVGYRIYRAADGGPWEPLGSSFAPGYLDMTAHAGASFSYAVVAYTATGNESPRSTAITVGTRLYRSYLPLVNRSISAR